MYYVTVREIEEIVTRFKEKTWVENVWRENKSVVILLSNGTRVRIKDF